MYSVVNRRLPWRCHPNCSRPIMFSRCLFKFDGKQNFPLPRMTFSKFLLCQLLRSTKEERFLSPGLPVIAQVSCARKRKLTRVFSFDRPAVHLFSAILNDVTISLRKGCCLVHRSLSDVRGRGCSLVKVQALLPVYCCLVGKLFPLCNAERTSLISDYYQ